MRSLLPAIGLWLALALPLAAAPLTADTPEQTAAGATFTAPAGWNISHPAPAVIALTAPEGDLTMAVVDASAADPALAVAEAWRAAGLAPGHALRLVIPQPARQGWEDERTFDYETSPNEHRFVQAGVFRRGGHWTVLVALGSESTLEKRGAAAQLVLHSLRPAGYSREIFAGRQAHALDPGRIEAIKAFVAQGMQELGVPGVGLALSDHGRIVYEGGIGVRQLGRPEPVDAHTLFIIASNTKGMSTLLLARLVDEGKLAWDAPVTSVYPAFRLGSPETTRKVLMRQLVCACTGLPRKDLDWIFDTSPATPASATFVQLAATEPTSAFGEVFQYNNLMASAAGYIGGHILFPQMELGAAYDRAMEEQIFRPLGMLDTTFDYERALAADHASPHGDDIDGVTRFSPAEIAFNRVMLPYRPAGGAWSSAHDAIRYADDELTEGVLPDGRRLVSAANLLARRKPSVPTGEDQAYGMGLETDRTWGVLVVHHGGSMAGYKSDWVAIPDAGVGAVLLTNSDEGGYLLRPFMRRLLEVIYDGRPEAAGDVAVRAAAIKADIAKERTRIVVPPDPTLAARLAAAYASPELGHIAVRREGASVVFDFGTWKSRMASRRNDDGTVSFVTIEPGITGISFTVDQAHGKRALVVRDGQHRYVYVEV